jgi:hypothetical protein
MRDHTGALEATLQAEYQIDIRDYWRRDEITGRPKLTLRRLGTFVKYASASSALAHELGSGWTTGHYLLSDLLNAFSGEHHPDDPRLKKHGSSGQDAAVVDIRQARARSHERRKRLGIRGSVLRRPS